MRAAPFPPDQGDEGGDAAGAQQQERGRESLLGQEFHQQLQGAQRHGDQQRALPVQPDFAGNLVAQVRQVACDEPESQDADGQVDVEHRAPAVVLGQRAAQGRADGVGDAKGGTEHDLPPQPHMGIGEQVGDGREGGAHQHAAADALQRPRQHQREHGVGGAAQGRRQREQHDGRDHERLAAVIIAEPAEDRHGDDGGQQVRRRYPCIQFEAPQFRHNGRKRRAHHRLVDGDHHHDEAHAQHGQQGLPERKDLAGRMRSAGGGGGHCWMGQ
ncbi:hypothetical protein D3C72_1196350 [compost metagenome]